MLLPLLEPEEALGEALPAGEETEEPAGSVEAETGTEAGEEAEAPLAVEITGAKELEPKDTVGAALLLPTLTYGETVEAVAGAEEAPVVCFLSVTVL